VLSPYQRVSCIDASYSAETMIHLCVHRNVLSLSRILDRGAVLPNLDFLKCVHRNVLSLSRILDRGAVLPNLDFNTCINCKVLQEGILYMIFGEFILLNFNRSPAPLVTQAMQLR